MNQLITISMLSLVAFMVLMGLRRTEWAMLLVMYLLPIEQLLSSYIPYLARNTMASNLLVGAVAVTAVLLEQVRGGNPFRGYINGATTFTALLYLFTILGAIWAPLAPAARYFLATGIPYYGLLLVFMPALASAEGLRRIQGPIVFVGCLILIFIILSPRTVIYGMRMFVDLSYATGSRDSRGNPLVIGELGGMIVIVAALMGSGANRPILLLFRIAAVLLGLWVTVLSAVRGQLIFAVLISVACYPLANEVKNLTQFFTKSAIAGVMCVFFYIAFKFFLSESGESAERWSSAEVSEGLSARTFFARELLGAYFSRPGYVLQGLGTGSFNAYVAHGSEGYIYPHNLFVEVLGEHGLIGFALLIGALVCVGAAAKRLILSAKWEPRMRPAYAMAVGLCGYMSMIAMKQGSYAIVPIPFHWYLVLAKVERRNRMDGLDQPWWDDETEAEEVEAAMMEDAPSGAWDGHADPGPA